ncbi:hypothetical protein LB507_003648, partial [Fusarium sp. FIESC RH6]
MKRYLEEIPGFCFDLAPHFIPHSGICRHVMSRGIRTCGTRDESRSIR